MTDIATRVLASAVATVATFAKHGLRFEQSGLRRANLDAAMGDLCGQLSLCASTGLLDHNYYGHLCNYIQTLAARCKQFRDGQIDAAALAVAAQVLLNEAVFLWDLLIVEDVQFPVCRPFPPGAVRRYAPAPVAPARHELVNLSDELVGY